MTYHKKYLKYKAKFLYLRQRQQKGGAKKDPLFNKLSRHITKILRHTAKSLRISMRCDGYVLVNELLEHLQGKHDDEYLTVETIQEIVETNNKQRLSLATIDNKLYIRANQGHSLGIDPTKLLNELCPGDVEHVYHGTYEKFMPMIKESGLSKMSRDQIHFTNKLPSGKPLSGMRATVEVVIEIDLPKAIADGLKFYRSDNGVILSPGNEDGIILPKYFKRIFRI
jgi:2'-phosphotransferase